MNMKFYCFLFLSFFSVITTFAAPEPEYYIRILVATEGHGTVKIFWNDIDITTTEINSFNYTRDEFVSVKVVMSPDPGYTTVVDGKDYGKGETSIVYQLADYEEYIVCPPGLSGSSLYQFTLPTVSFTSSHPVYLGDMNCDGVVNIADITHLSDILLGNREQKKIDYGEITENDLSTVASDYMQIHKVDGTTDYVFVPDIKFVDYMNEGTYPTIKNKGTEMVSLKLRAKAGQTLKMTLSRTVRSFFDSNKNLLGKESVTVYVSGCEEPIYYDEANSSISREDYKEGQIIQSMKIASGVPLSYVFVNSGIFSVTIQLQQSDPAFFQNESPQYGYIELSDIHLE